MIKIKNLTVKNFMSIGNATQAVNFDRNDLTLVLGEDVDQGSNGARNGTGKTSLINALSYGLYGAALSDIRVNNLVNKTNQKNMLVSVEFDIEGTEYRIERGRAPNVLKFYKDNTEQKDDENTAQGETRETQKEINELLGLSHSMFKHTIALNTYTTPFLSLRAAEQKDIIEELLGIGVLTEKAEALKAVNKRTKESIKEEEFRLEAVIKANMHIEEQISALKRRHRAWQIKKDATVGEYVLAIEKLMEVDIDAEIQSHKDNQKAKENAKTEWYELTRLNQAAHDLAMNGFIEEKDKVNEHNANVTVHNDAIKAHNKSINACEREQVQLERRAAGLEKDIALLLDHKCHSCGQDLHDEKQEKNIASKQTELDEVLESVVANELKETEHKLKLADLHEPLEFTQVPRQPKQEPVARIEPKLTETFYKTFDEAHGHKSSLETLTTQLETAVGEIDPYTEQIQDMTEKGLQEVEYDEMNKLVELQEHQVFLLKLLTSKDSFIRKKIIEQNLAYLNNRLTHYLTEIGLPHSVRFMSDLSVEISEMGRELDFDNLSRGERTRLILSLSWAFRDVWESLYNHVNLLFVDELVDNGLDTNGVEASIKIMKGYARERGKSVWLVSHREELLSRVNNTMKVIKEGGFTMYDTSID